MSKAVTRTTQKVLGPLLDAAFKKGEDYAVDKIAAKSHWGRNGRIVVGGKRRTKRRKTKSHARITTTNAPVSMGSAIPRSQFSIQGHPAKADISTDGAIRVVGTCLFQAATFGNQGNSTYTGLLNGSSTNLYCINLTPINIDLRLGSIEKIYGYYCIRKFTVHYVPACSTGTNGLIAIAIDSDVNRISSTAPTVQGQLMECDASVLTSVWAPAQFTYRDNGSRVYETAANGSAFGVQAVMGAAFQVNITSPLQAGLAFIEYVVDFYDPSMFNPTVNSPEPKPKPDNTPKTTLLSESCHTNCTTICSTDVPDIEDAYIRIPRKLVQ